MLMGYPRNYDKLYAVDLLGGFAPWRDYTFRELFLKPQPNTYMQFNAGSTTTEARRSSSALGSWCI